ncbi:MAG TPA: Asd/ArgC dimerization domain-containing protein [Candidatus Acidoferrum sp.]
MPSIERESHRIVIAGASSLLGAELKALLEESKFAGWDLRLLDEEDAAGTLTEAGGEPVVIQPVDEGSFERARFVFFTGSREFAERNFAAALAAGAVAIDFTGKVSTKEPAPSPWFPKLDEFWSARFTSNGTQFWIPSSAAVAATSLSFGLRPVGLRKLSITFFRPVSEAGRAGIEELESQTGQLLSFQSVGKPVFDTQVAFNLLERYGSLSRQNLARVRKALREEIKECVATHGAVLPALQVLHAPTFYGMMFSACAELDPGVAKSESVSNACRGAGFSVAEEEDCTPSNVSAAGENTIQLGVPQADPAVSGTWWFWGAADNVRLPAWNAVKLAERLL